MSEQAAPSYSARNILCPGCGLVIARYERGAVVMRHHKRGAVDPVAIVCDRCGATWWRDGRHHIIGPAQPAAER